MESSTVILRTLRATEWEKAKGHLMAMLNTYWGDEDDPADSHEKISAKIEEFVKAIEDGGLHE